MDRSWRNCLRARSIKILIAIAIALISIACSNIFPPDPQITNESVSKPRELTIWWEQGYNLEEDQALQTVVNNWQKQTGYKAKLSFFTNDELIPKVERAVEANQLPDLMMSIKGNQILYPRLAWQDRLEDVSDLIKPIQDDYSAKILQAITYSNYRQGKRSYYGVPVHQSTIFIFYWQKLLASIGLKSSDIPQNWADFWQFWQQAQVKLKEQNLNIYSLGFPLAGDKRADDTHYLFEQILEANNINLLNDRGELEIDRPKIRQGIIKCLNWYAQLYQQGYIPPNAVNWSNTDNNLNLLNRLVLMTPNPTLSIPATVRQDADTYYNQLGIAEFPHKPNGKPMRYLLSIKQAVIFKNSLHKSLAKKFIRYFIQPQVTINYLKATNGRGQPVRKSVWSDPFWQNSPDPYIATARKILTTGQTRLSYEVKYPAYSQVLAENVWGQALTKVTAKQVKPEQAADEAIARIKDIFAEWDQQ
jgi:multiple sugar transport system substrate-binding protein